MQDWWTSFTTWLESPLPVWIGFWLVFLLAGQVEAVWKRMHRLHEKMESELYWIRRDVGRILKRVDDE